MAEVSLYASKHINNITKRILAINIQNATMALIYLILRRTCLLVTHTFHTANHTTYHRQQDIPATSNSSAKIQTRERRLVYNEKHPQFEESNNIQMGYFSCRLAEFDLTFNYQQRYSAQQNLLSTTTALIKFVKYQ